MPSLARSVPKPLKVPSLARSVPKPLKLPSLARSVSKPLNGDLIREVKPCGWSQRAPDKSPPSLSTPYQLVFTV